MSMMIEVTGPAALMPPLSPCEENCLRLLAEGRRPPEIGLALSMAELEVEDLLGSAADKLGARNRLHAVTVAIRRGYVDLRNAGPE